MTLATLAAIRAFLDDEEGMAAFPTTLMEARLAQQ